MIQKLLRQRRIHFVKECSCRHLYQSYVKNRYMNQEYRNEFEVDRIWDQITYDFLEILIDKAKQNPELRKSVLQILIGRAEEISEVLDSYDMQDERQRILEAMKGLYDDRKKTQQQILTRFIDGKKEREFEFMELMVEMMDAAEERRARSK